jgi:hypothetical protein
MRCLGNGHARNNGTNCCFIRGLFRGNNGSVFYRVLSQEVFSTGSIPRLYNSDPAAVKSVKYKRLKLGGGQAYDRSND